VLTAGASAGVLDDGIGGRAPLATITVPPMQIRSRLAGLVRLPRPVARRVDAAYGRRAGWVYMADGLATLHYSPFLDDAEFSRLYERMARDSYGVETVDARWRMWVLTRYALHARNLPGNYAEFGTYRGGCAWLVLATADLEPSRRFHLFDTFSGIPDDRLTEDEREAGFAGRLSDTSIDYVRTLLERWDPIPQLWPGDVFETIPAADTGELVFVHMDLNAAAPTLHVLEHVYDRVVLGGIFIFDDYGWPGYEDQRAAIDAFLLDRPEELIALPTGQAVLTKVAR
jgi:O-methyltransferase